MGEIERDLCRTELPDREPHSSRMFIDLCENIHIHHRDLRIVFSLDEFFEFANILADSVEDVRSYLAQNPEYREGEYSDTIMVAGSKVRQRKLLRNSPRPNQSAYMANEFAIELQTGRTTDEIHVHWRDYRFVLTRKHFKIIADCFTEARRNLDDYERAHAYVRLPHADRTMDSYAEERQKFDDVYSGWQDIVRMPIHKIVSRYEDITTDWDYDRGFVQKIVGQFKAGQECFPILLSTEPDGTNMVIDGNHRLCAAHLAGVPELPCVVAPVTFDESEPFRRAETLLKRFDRHTGHQFSTVGFNKEWLAYKLGRHYAGHYYRNVTFKRIWPFRYWYEFKRNFYRWRHKAKRRTRTALSRAA